MTSSPGLARTPASSSSSIRPISPGLRAWQRRTLLPGPRPKLRSTGPRWRTTPELRPSGWWSKPPTPTPPSPSSTNGSFDGGSTDGELKGLPYKIRDRTAVGIVDDNNVVIGSSKQSSKAAVDASKVTTSPTPMPFGDLSGHVADGALATVFTNNDPYLAALKQQGFDLGGLYSALGINLDGSAP